MPYFNKPTINIGSRQKGRLMDNSIINVEWNKTKIKKAIYKSLFRKKKFKNKYLFGNGGSTKKIIKILSKIKFNNLIIKKFYDII